MNSRFSDPFLSSQEPTSDPDARAHGWLFVRLIVVLAALAILYLRMPTSFSNPQFWGEDVDFFFQVRTQGWTVLTTPMAGYFVTVQWLVALVASYFDATLAPTIYNYVAFALTLTVVSLATSPRFDMQGKPLLALAVVIVPMGYEELGTITNIQWILPIGAFVILFMRASRSAILLIGEMAFLALMAMSGPFCVFLTPLFCWRVIALWNSPERLRMVVLTLVVGLGALTQLLSLATHRSEFADPVLPASYSWTLWINLPFSKFMTTFSPTAHFASGLGGVVVAMILLAAAAGLAIRTPYRTQKLFMLGLGLIIAVSGMYKFRAALETQIDAQRYFYIGCVFSLWFICCLARGVVLRFASFVLVAVAELMLLPAIANTPRIPNNLEWKTWARNLSSGVPVVIPTSPGGFYLSLPPSTDGPLTRYISWIGRNINEVATEVASSRCSGSIQTVEKINVANPQSFADAESTTDLWSVKGKAWDRVGNLPIQLVAVADQSGRVRGLGVPGFASAIPFKADEIFSGWAAAFNAEPGISYRGFAVLDDGQSICALHERTVVVQPMTSNEFLKAVEFTAGHRVTQRFKPSKQLEEISVALVTWARRPSAYSVNWQVTAVSDGRTSVLGQGKIDANAISDGQLVDMPLSVLKTRPDLIEVSFSTDAGSIPLAPIGVPLYRPLPGASEPPVEIDGVPDSSGAQMGLRLSYGE